MQIYDTVDNYFIPTDIEMTPFVKMLWPFLKTEKKFLIFGFFLMGIATVVSLLSPYLTIGLMNQVLVPLQNHQHVRVGQVFYYLTAFFVIALCTWLFTWAQTYVLAITSEKVTKNLRMHGFRHILSLSLDFYNHRRKGDLITRIGQDTDRLNIFIATKLVVFIHDIVLFAITLGFVFSINKELGWYTIIPIPIILILSTLLKNKLNFLFEQCNRIWSQVINVLTETIFGIRLIKCFAKEARFITQFEKINQKNLVINNLMNRIWAFFSPTTVFITDLGVLLVWGMGIRLMWQHQINLGVLTGFIAYSNKLYSRIESFSAFFEDYRRANVYLKRIFDLLNKTSTIHDTLTPVPIPQVDGRIDIKKVNFSYNNHQVMFDVNLTILPGEHVGFVGLSGAGKSTLMNLICRFYDPDTGGIFLDNINIKDFSFKDYRNILGVVLQESYLFYGTIADNIRFANPDASFEEIMQAAKYANAHEFILRQPLGYDTLIQENGSSLSGGEKQRIVIARTILSDPKILLLDEPTAAVDGVNEYKIQEALKFLTHKRTTIVISHRLSSLKSFDKLVMVDKGRVVEVGSHQELMALQGCYYHFYQSYAKLF